MNDRTGRARPLSPEDRRAAILDAVVPLLIEKGGSVTTAEMAEAAGIAEGTIFRVYPDKPTLLHAAIVKMMDPEPIRLALEGIDPAGPAEDQLVAAAGELGRRFESIVALLGVVRSMPASPEHRSEAHRTAHDAMTAIADALTALFERHRDRLQVEPTQAAVLLRSLAFANAHDMLGPDRMTAEQLVKASSQSRKF